MVFPDRNRLGWVKVDETTVSGEEEGVSGRQTLKKMWVVIVQVDVSGTGASECGR